MDRDYDSMSLLSVLDAIDGGPGVLRSHNAHEALLILPEHDGPACCGDRDAGIAVAMPCQWLSMVSGQLSGVQLSGVLMPW